MHKWDIKLNLFPFSPDIVVDITAVAEKKADAICAHESQVYEWLP